METKQNKKLLWGIVLYAALFLAILWISNIAAVNQFFSKIVLVFRPLLIGLVIAYLCNPIFRTFERKLFYRVRPKGLRRGLSLFCSYLIFVLIFALLLLLIVPQLIDSIVQFSSNAESYVDSTSAQLNALIGKLNQSLASQKDGDPLLPYLDAEALKTGFSHFLKSLRLDIGSLLQFVNTDTIDLVIGLAGGLLQLLADVIFGCFISLYLLLTKEKRYAQIMRYRRAFLSDGVNEVITRICTTADRSFGGFLKGKILDSAIIGVLVYIAISIMDVPYALLIAATIAITDIIPIIGPFIGVIPSAVIILLTDPGKVIPFLLCILVIQQIDGNILAPKVLGEHTGVSSLCVIIAVTTLGSLWGLVGMIVGVPLFATVLELTGEVLDKRLKKKGLSTDTEDYYTPELAGEQHAASHVGIPTVAPIKKRRQKERIPGGTGDLSPAEREALSAHQCVKEGDAPVSASEKAEEDREQENP